MELLVVIAIVSILAAIALSQFTAYKKQAIDAEMQSDLHHGRTAMENYYQFNDYSYLDATVPELEADHGYKSASVPSPPSLQIVTLEVDRYVLRSCVPNGSYLSYSYDSDTGRIVGENVAC